MRISITPATIRKFVTALVLAVGLSTVGTLYIPHTVSAFSAINAPTEANAPISSDICEAGSAAADTEVCIDQSTGRFTVLGSNSIFELITNTIIMLVGAFSVIMIVIGGFKYVLSSGDSSATKSAKDTILYALIGLTIAIFSKFIVTLVLNSSFFK